MRTPQEIGKIVRQLRGSLSLREFAKKCGLSHSTIDYIEKGVDFRTGKPTNPSAVVLSKIAEASGVTLQYIIGDTNETPLPAEDNLSDGEKALLELFRSASPYQQEVILRMIAAAVTPKG